MLKNTKSKTRKLEEKFRLRMDFKATASMLNMQLMMRNSKERSAKKTRELL